MNHISEIYDQLINNKQIKYPFGDGCQNPVPPSSQAMKRKQIIFFQLRETIRISQLLDFPIMLKVFCRKTHIMPVSIAMQ